jgi:DNA-binding NtrC family response regulator
MTSRGHLLIVDDEPVIRESLAKWFAEEGYEVGTAASAGDALTRLASERYDLALIDIKMPGTDGLELQRRIRQIDPGLRVIIMTGYASVETAITALKNGAYDYVTKPFDPESFSNTVKNALAHRKADSEVLQLREAMAEGIAAPEIIGQGTAMRKVFDAIESVGPTEATVLIYGESGTGKELVARAIHAASPRRFNPLVVIHCGALTDTLLESELFGHERGAFTGAQYRKKGKFEVADHGTVFLDEIGDISLKSQTDLLRVLQNHEITRVGSTRSMLVDFRCIAATNRKLDEAIAAGSFRPDLFYRLNVFGITVPPLRQRREDIPALVSHFIGKFSRSMSKKVSKISASAMRALQNYDWPGNVRELENAVERAMVVGREPMLEEADFGLRPHSTGGHPQSLDDVERDYIMRILQESAGNKTRAAKILGIDRVTLHNRLKRYGLKAGPALQR